MDIYKRGTERFTLRLWGRRPSTATGSWQSTDERCWYDIFLEDARSTHQSPANDDPHRTWEAA